MSELINNSRTRKDLLKHMILQLHEGVAPEEIKGRIKELIKKIPYGEVVEVEQELISEGLPDTEILRLCDIHSEVLENSIDLSGMLVVAPGHPVDTFKKENREVEKLISQVKELCENSLAKITELGQEKYANQVKFLLNSLTDIDKHYRRKENLLFPYMEKAGITGPPKVMWGKDDEIRDALKNAISTMNMPGDVNPEIMQMRYEIHIQPALKGITDMIMKEEEILFPMTLDKLNEGEWYEIYKQTGEIGYCLYDPPYDWKPAGIEESTDAPFEGDTIALPSGRFTAEELLAILNTLAVDITFVDRNDKVKYFSQGKERIFDRNRAILGRDVRMCHPPSSVHVVDQIIADFKSGAADSAPFWINMHGKFIHIEYFALRNEKGEYLGTLEMSQDLTEKRALQGDQRILSYKKQEKTTETSTTMNKPQWLNTASIKITLDARPLLAQGIHPLERVIQEAGTLKAGEIYEIITPFPPSPMIEKLTAMGFEAFSQVVPGDGQYHTYFLK
jgi:uncharacterized protein